MCECVNFIEDGVDKLTGGDGLDTLGEDSPPFYGAFSSATDSDGFTVDELAATAAAASAACCCC